MTYRRARFNTINNGLLSPRLPFHSVRTTLFLRRIRATPVRKGTPTNFDNCFMERRMVYGYPVTDRRHDGFCSAAGRKL
jgi:hypothetical protein